MSSTLEHFSHPHILELKDDDIVRADAKCYGCEKPVIGSLTYTCTSLYDLDCKNFYLHKSCAELPTQIKHHMHNKHLLTLLLRHHCYCDACGHEWNLFTYGCKDCQFYMCVICAFEQRELHHEGHQEHTLILMQKTALFDCDACERTAEDTSYICTTCEFWIHKECALSPSIIPNPTYHHHPLNLIFSIPDMHRYFIRYCAICYKIVHVNYWVYYCQRCTYFVHMRCSTSTVTVSTINEIEADDSDNELDLVQFPLRSEESLFDLIMTQCSKLQIDFQGKGENDITVSTIPNDPHVIEVHWSHRNHLNHPLQLLRLTISENDNDDNDDERRVLICDGCIQPITVSHPNYYACIQCGYFLHSFCATKLPMELPKGASSFHPEHSLSLGKRSIFYSISKCEVCCYFTNGFYYYCEACDIKIDIRCAFLPARVKHKSHKHHYLVQRPFSNSRCSISMIRFKSGREYACETCSDFKIHMACAFYPSRLKHKYDLHPITLRTPPFFYEGVFYCEICEEQVDNQRWLYHCSESDHSYHYNCLHWRQNVKLGGTIKLFANNQPHTFALVLKWPARFNSPRFFCANCKIGCESTFFFECIGCGILVCWVCALKITCG